jgi:predicted thioredoxin/glutaredoxin
LSSDPAPLSFLLYSRAGCGLCEEMLAALAALPAACSFPVDVLDVDADPQARQRYGHKVPVLLFGGELVCHGHLEPDEVDKAIAYHRRPV